MQRRRKTQWMLHAELTPLSLRSLDDVSIRIDISLISLSWLPFVFPPHLLRFPPPFSLWRPRILSKVFWRLVFFYLCILRQHSLIPLVVVLLLLQSISGRTKEDEGRENVIRFPPDDKMLIKIVTSCVCLVYMWSSNVVVGTISGWSDGIVVACRREASIINYNPGPLLPANHSAVLSL